MNKSYYTQGFTLVELMIVVAIIGIVSSIAVPAYHSYIATSEVAVARSNAETLAGFEDIFFYEGSTYKAGSYTVGGADNLSTALGWLPSNAGNDVYNYVVVGGPSCSGDITQCIAVTATHVANTASTATVFRP